MVQTVTVGFPTRARTYTYVFTSVSALWSTPLPIKYEWGAPFSTVQRPECEIDSPPLCSAEAEAGLYCNTPLRLYGVMNRSEGYVISHFMYLNCLPLYMWFKIHRFGTFSIFHRLMFNTKKIIENNFMLLEPCILIVDLKIPTNALSESVF
jgi:hypothetical protein